MSSLYPTLAELQAKLSAAQAELAEAKAAARRLSAANGERFGTDPAIASGVRRKPNARADSRRYGAYDREAAAYQRLTAAEAEVEQLTRRVAREQRDADVPFTPEHLAAATHIRDRNGWHKVVRVNKTTVTVDVAPSWDNKVSIVKIREVRRIEQAAA